MFRRCALSPSPGEASGPCLTCMPSPGVCDLLSVERPLPPCFPFGIPCRPLAASQNSGPQSKAKICLPTRFYRVDRETGAFLAISFLFDFA
jgi:hypothetical protein